MKLLFPALGLSTSFVSTSSAALIAFWDFDTPYDERVDGDFPSQITFDAAEGSGIIYQQRADIDGNGSAEGQAFTDTATGITRVAGENNRAMKWDDVNKGGPENDAEFFLSIDTTGFENIHISFDLQGNSMEVGDDPNDFGIINYDLKFSLNALEDITVMEVGAELIKDFMNGVSTDALLNQSLSGNTDNFSRIEVDLSAFTAINDQGVVNLRFDDLEENRTLTIDNILIFGDAIPEPSSSLLLGLFGISLLQRRDR